MAEYANSNPFHVMSPRSQIAKREINMFDKQFIILMTLMSIFMNHHQTNLYFRLRKEDSLRKVEDKLTNGEKISMNINLFFGWLVTICLVYACWLVWSKK